MQCSLSTCKKQRMSIMWRRNIFWWWILWKYNFFEWKWLITDKECDDKNCALCPEDGKTCKVCLDGFALNGQNECKPTTCLVANCALCDDGSTCNECNAPYQLIRNKECRLCEEGTYFDNGFCESISF